MYLLDSYVLSELRRGRSRASSEHVTAWFDGIEAERFYISVISVLELELGVRLVERRDALSGAHLRKWLDSQLMPSFADRTLPIDRAIAVRCAHLHVPDRRPERDALIAATALVHGLTLITRDVKDFAPTGVPMVDPWSDSGAALG